MLLSGAILSLLVFFVALGACQCVISLSVKGINNEIYPGFVHAPSNTDFDMRLHPSIVSGGATCASSGFRAAIQFGPTDLTPTPSTKPTVTGFSGGCKAVVGSITGGTGTKQQVITYTGCSSTSQIGVVALHLRFASKSIGYEANVNVFTPCVTYPCSPSDQTHTTKLLWLGAGAATVIGDPKISGFHHQEFDFNGEVGRVYHVYSDQYVSVNALFAAANPFDSTVKGTVMDSMFVRFGDKHTLEFSAWSINNATKEVSVIVDGKTSAPLVLPADDSRHKLTGCSWLSWEGKHLLLGQGKFEHVVTFTIQARDKKHLNTSYVNVELDLAHPDAAEAGGLIGWTAEKRPVLRTYHDSSRVLISAPPEVDYVTSSLVAQDAKTNKFKARNYRCPKKN